VDLDVALHGISQVGEDLLLEENLNSKAATSISVRRSEINPLIEMSEHLTAATGDPLVCFDQVTLRLRDRKILPDTNWQIQHGQSWAVIGENGAGKSTLVAALAGLVPVVAGRIHRHGPQAQPDAIGYAAFENEHRFVAHDRIKDEARAFSGRFRGGIRVDEALRATAASNPALARVCATMALEDLAGSRVRHLSSGEMRRLFIARALLRTEKLLILDEPFEGLDRHHRHHLAKLLEATIAASRQLVLVTHHLQNIPAGISRVIALKEGRVVAEGERAQMLGNESQRRIFNPRSAMRAAASFAEPQPSAPTGQDRDIIRFNEVPVRYGDQVVVRNLSWRVRAGEHWALSGPNGAGKSTLLAMIAGDHHQAYANEIYLFGRRRGSGESIWEIKRHIGMVSAEMHRRYHRRVTVEDTVASGFFDSVGLYRRCSPAQRQQVTTGLQRLGIDHLRTRPLATLSYGQQRLALIARAMVKKPALLILDEPCQGLDPVQRRRMITAIDQIGRSRSTQIIYVSHHAHEIPACITHHLSLDDSTTGVI
jgi:molybdate transport system ATP-binding protein